MSEPRELAKLRIPPIEVEMDGHLAQIGRPLRACFKLHNSGVAQLQAHVGARWLAAQPDPPRRRDPAARRKDRRSISENGSFSTPFLKLIRELVAAM